LTEADLIGWCTATGANNTVRQRMSTARTFLGWCLRRGLIDSDPSTELDRLKKQYPKTYGKVQSAHPARWLSRDDAFGTLLSACQDGTWIGSRDQLALRLGLMGVRNAEAVHMTWGNLTADGRLVWIGKGRRQRTVTPGPTFLDLLARWRRKYERELGQPVASTDPILCREVLGAARQGGPRRVAWGEPMSQRTFFAVVQRRSQGAGLGHVAPHDLRRSAAGILHDTRSADGGHVYDLLDIQKVLDHADPATTQRSYLSPMSSDVKKAAGSTLD
jgi:integrase/recombinase XerC